MDKENPDVQELAQRGIAWGSTAFICAIITAFALAVDLWGRWGEALMVEVYPATFVWLVSLMLGKFSLNRMERIIKRLHA